MDKTPIRREFTPRRDGKIQGYSNENTAFAPFTDWVIPKYNELKYNPSSILIARRA